MKRIILNTILALAFGTAVSSAETIAIGAGAPGNGYDRAAQKAATMLEQRGRDVEVRNLTGSDEITLGICRGELVAGYTQIDAMDARASEGCRLRPVATYGNGELAMIFFPPKSKADALDELTGDSKVLVGPVGSGSSLFWDTARRIETGDHGNKSKWSQAKAVNEPFQMAEALASFGDIEAVIMVGVMDNADAAALIKRGWTLGELYDKDLNDYVFNGDSLYKPTKIKGRIAGKKVKGYGYDIRSFAVTTETTAADRALFADLVKALQ